jgi:hypothetical protein
MKVSIFKRLESIHSTDPELTPANWCVLQPCKKITIGSRKIILTQPSSSFLVYLLGFLTTGIGLFFLFTRGDQISRLWWGISMLLWGIGALLAGTSYQAFGYEIKCAGRTTCSWTSWWEVVYLIFQQLSMDSMLVAVAYSSAEGMVRWLLLLYALITGALYTISTFLGGLIPVKSLITFRWMVWVSTPVLVIVFIINGYRYYTSNDPMDLALIATWMLLILTSCTYSLYDRLNITEKLWKARGIWFSQNDILHVCLIFWMIFIATTVASLIRDIG